MNPQEAIEVAIKFESKAFQDAADKVSLWDFVQMMPNP